MEGLNADRRIVCGIVGIACGVGRRVGVGAEGFARMRDRVAHRGPDGAGTWDGGHVVLGHRRLAVVDLSEASAQPMVFEGGVLAYNGELYNDAEVRGALSRDGAEFRTRGDVETVGRALERWGRGALSRMRGMYALGWYERKRERVVLARDPLGVKPLYYAFGRREDGGTELVFASEAGAVLTHPGVTREADAVGVMGYLTTIRTTVGSRTMYRDVRVLEPGEWIEFELTRDGVREVERGRTEAEIDEATAARLDAALGNAGTEDVGARWVIGTRVMVEDSLERHLKADVGTCCLLSGGLDSTILASLAAGRVEGVGRGRLRTYCAGGVDESVGEGEDFACARVAAEAMGTEHGEVRVTRGEFASRWGELVRAHEMPLSTPNEVAIEAVSRRLRSAGSVVAISGEGADELFAGYHVPLIAAMGFHARGGTDGGGFALEEASWIAPAGRWGVLRRTEEREAAGAEVAAWYRRAYAACAEESAGDALGAHLRLQQRVNLAGLLMRLDANTMRAGVEGRTPFADAAVAWWSRILPEEMKVAVDGTGQVETKVALRRAFADRVPRAILERPKASFPMPFREWMADAVGAVEESRLVASWFTREAVEVVKRRGGEAWRIAWPMVNLALWERGASGFE